MEGMRERKGERERPLSEIRVAWKESAYFVGER
jgi:hypothetical protein